MKITKRNALRLAVVCTAAGLMGVGCARQARADLLSGLSLRVGGYMTTEGGARHVAGFGAPGIGLDYQIPWMPHLFSGEGWTSSLSVDVYYRDWDLGVDNVPGSEHAFRNIPVSINQIYHFEENGRTAPYLGFCITAATYGNTGAASIAHQPTVTRFGGGVIFGADFTGTHMYLEGRYEAFVRGHAAYVPDGFRATLGYRF